MVKRRKKVRRKDYGGFFVESRRIIYGVLIIRDILIYQFKPC
jgi:hypothetical protein